MIPKKIKGLKITGKFTENDLWNFNVVSYHGKFIGMIHKRAKGIYNFTVVVGDKSSTEVFKTKIEAAEGLLAAYLAERI